MKLHQQPFNRNSSRNSSRSNSTCCSYPTARTKPKAGTGTNCNLNAQEQDKQHIELQKQHLDLPEQAPPHEIASAALQQKQQQKQQKQQQMLLIPHGPNQTQSRNRHQLQFKCAGTRQAAHRIAETASRPARAGTSTWICTSSPSTETPTGGSTEPGGNNICINEGYPKMDGLQWKILEKWMICGYHQELIQF